ncbi:MAG: phosphoribosylaminoimidazolesuccinocarboxamide synthase [Candidatus Nezhaarchaeota archaeon]|nr:phosphoribosylaminoimidazolesuccinocarboxamide synthase [Candidatus Nezhaarchaeota archaeon]MCX8141430.1 phosphoribosylaminoimidazolesuccinocarboxamide synthase [Candidatus Nezhaarchaeota archaeon]MDW8049696.1 phosphoribosylaminoimidazolesuccinocarboxamide synthase [Nitrososphaerota archaeon]
MSYRVGELIASGKTKLVYSLNNPLLVLLKFKDDVTALDGKKKDTIPGKGAINAAVSAKLFQVLKDGGVDNHYVEMYDATSLVVKKLEMIPVEVVCRNIATGSIVKRLPIKEGEVFDPPIVEFFLKDDARGDPMINDSHMIALKLASRSEIDKIIETMLKANEILRRFLASRGLTLLDFKLEFGRRDGEIMIGDEIDPDCMRIRDSSTQAVLDKDLYRKGASLEDVKRAYEEVYRRIVKE